MTERITNSDIELALKLRALGTTWQETGKIVARIKGRRMAYTVNGISRAVRAALKAGTGPQDAAEPQGTRETDGQGPWPAQPSGSWTGPA
jgi:hypothetical protein